MNSTTPFKQRRGIFGIDQETQENQNEDRGEGYGDDPMLSSPPRPLSAGASISNLPATNLFGDDDSTDATSAAPTCAAHNKRHSRRRQMPLRPSRTSSSSLSGSEGSSAQKVLRPLDLNARSLGTTGSDMSIDRISARLKKSAHVDELFQTKHNKDHRTLRKRPSDSLVSGREEVWEDSDEDMFLSPRSPRASPTPRASPNSYRTMDGRTVTSRNPFSPYTPCEMEDDSVLMMESATKAPLFPYSLHPASSKHKNLQLPTNVSVPSPTISLQRRDTSTTNGYVEPFRQTYFGPSKTGFPDRQGQYSFTGSPIEEVDYMEASTGGTPAFNNKIRRLHDDDHVPKPRKYYIDTKAPMINGVVPEEISPTDVSSFPSPPTPVKAARPLYTPLRPAPPQTPCLQRRRDADDEENDDLVMIHSSKNNIPKSRFAQDFDVIGHLGNGSFGTVYKCLSRLDGCMYAVKAAKRKAKGNADRDRMLKEVYALAALSDQADTAAFNIVRYHQAWMEENRLYIQTELCSFTLDTEIKRGPMTVPRRYKLLREILVALEFIHRNGMVHLDIKPENVFVKNDQYKLGDFGLVSKTTNSSDVEEGDSRYMSMELLSGNHVDLTKSDIFSLGATMYQICLGRDLPMSGQEWQDIRSGTLQLLKDTPFAMENIIKSMMHPDPSKRPYPSQLLKKNELLSEDQKQLLREKEKVLQVNMALALQSQRLKKLSPPRPGGLIRANTWNGSFPKFM